MEIIQNKINHKLNLKDYIKTNNACFLDIETTGLSRYRDIIYLIGVLYYDSALKSWILKQYFINKENKESDLLRVLAKDISVFEKIITYNGDLFDIPFINNRLKLYSIHHPIDSDKSFDLYKIVRQNRKFLDLDNLKLKTIEESLGIYREDMYSGFECIALYKDYLKTRDSVSKEIVLKHNYDDLIYMLDIMKILDVLNDKKSINLDIGPFAENNLNIEDLFFSKDILEIYLSTSLPLKNNIKYYSNNFSATSTNLRNINISIDVKHGYVSENIKSAYIKKESYPNIKESISNDYNISDNIYILSENKKYCIQNIKNLILAVLKHLK